MSEAYNAIETKEAIPKPSLDRLFVDMTGQKTAWPGNVEPEPGVNEKAQERRDQVQNVILGWLDEEFVEPNQFLEKLSEAHNKDPRSGRQKAYYSIPIIEERLKQLPVDQLPALLPGVEINGDIDYQKLAKEFADNGPQNWHYIHLQKPRNLYQIGSVLQGTEIATEHPIEQLKKAVQGKKILVLGDDCGNLSEQLNVLGAEAYGIEFNERKIRLAHSGFLAKDFKPQMQMTQGDLWDLRDEQTELFQQMQTKGPFDLIFSTFLINIGSGLGESNPDKGELLLPRAEEWFKFFSGTEKLLKPEGVNLHEGIDIEEAVVTRAIEREGNDRDWMRRKYGVENMKFLEDNYVRTGRIHSNVMFLTKAGVFSLLQEKFGDKLQDFFRG